MTISGKKRNTLQPIVLLASVDGVLVGGTVVFAVLHRLLQNSWTLAVAISLGTTAYHFLVRLLIGEVVTLFFRVHHANPDNFWFRPRKWERKIYRLLRIKRWKTHLPTAKPEQFDLQNNSPDGIVQNICQAEIVHELCLLASFAPCALIPRAGEPVVFLLTSIMGALIDLAFVVIQRYNRPRLQKLSAHVKNN